MDWGLGLHKPAESQIDRYTNTLWKEERNYLLIYIYLYVWYGYNLCTEKECIISLCLCSKWC